MQNIPQLPRVVHGKYSLYSVDSMAIALISLVVWSPLLQTKLPCDNPSDFNGKTMFGEGDTCQDMSSFLLPASAAECTMKPFPDGPGTKADMIKIMYARCCKRGSKPNPVCGFKTSSGATPCASKAAGEFLPEAM